MRQLDMVIENNASTIRVLEPYAAKISVLSTEQAARLKLGDSLDTLHIRSIIRLYGEQGFDAVELLKRSPATAVGLIGCVHCYFAISDTDGCGCVVCCGFGGVGRFRLF